MKSKWIIGGVVIAGTIVAMSLLNLGDDLVYFYTPSEAVAKAADLGKNTIKIGALVKSGSVQWEARDLDLTFVLTDLSKTLLQSYCPRCLSAGCFIVQISHLPTLDSLSA